MTVPQFIRLSDAIAAQAVTWDSLTKVKAIDMRNKIMLLFIWVFHYEQYDSLQTHFLLNRRQVSLTIKEGLSYLVGFFLQHLTPFPFQPQDTSSLSTKIKFVIDGTIHPILKPCFRQNWWYREDKKCHFYTTMLVVDFNGYIHYVRTGCPGSLHDSSIVRMSPDLKNAMDGQYCLADPGFQALNEAVAGFKVSQLDWSDPKQRKFHQISRHEQIIVENVNAMIKKAKVLSKKTFFRHPDHSLLVGAVLIVCGIHNYRRSHNWDVIEEEESSEEEEMSEIS